MSGARRAEVRALRLVKCLLVKKRRRTRCTNAAGRELEYTNWRSKQRCTPPGLANLRGVHHNTAICITDSETTDGTEEVYGTLKRIASNMLRKKNWKSLEGDLRRNVERWLFLYSEHIQH